MHVFFRTEEVGQGRNDRFLHRAVERGHGNAVEFENAGTNLLDRVLLLAELGGVVDFYLVAALGSFLDQFAEIFHALNGRISVGVRVR